MNKMSKYWFISDTHFGHFNIVEYCNRPFKTLEEMDSTLIRKWNSRVKPGDQVFHLGDFCFKNTFGGKNGEGSTNKAEFYEKQLNGKIILVCGNHDHNNSAKSIISSIDIMHGGSDIHCVHDPVAFEVGKLNLCGHVHCFDKGTEVLTRNGWAKYDKVRINDEVLTLNLNSGILEWNNILNKVIRNERKLLHFYSRNMDLKVSSDHRILMKGHKRTKKWEFRLACDILKIKQFMVPLSGTYETDGIHLSDDQIRLYAWFVTEGTCYQVKYNGKKIKSLYNRVEICQTNKHGYQLEIELILKRLNIRYRKDTRKILTKSGYTAYDFAICKQDCKFLDLCLFNGKYCKVIPQYFRGMNRHQFEIFLDTLLKGDGHRCIGGKYKGQAFQFGGSKENLDLLQELCVRYGYSSHVFQKKNNKNWIMSGNRKNNGYVMTRKTIDNYNDVVWCLSVPNETLVIRSDGKTSITGNCKWKLKWYDSSTPILNCGVDVWNFMPISINEILSFLARNPYRSQV